METRAFEPLYTPAAGTPGTPFASPSTTAGTFSNSVTVTATNASATASGMFPGMMNNQKVQLQIANTTTSWAYVNVGVFGSVTAATVAASYPVAPGSVVVVSVANEVTSASVILGSVPGTATAVIFTRGEGL